MRLPFVDKNLFGQKGEKKMAFDADLKLVRDNGARMDLLEFNELKRNKPSTPKKLVLSRGKVR